MSLDERLRNAAADLRERIDPPPPMIDDVQHRARHRHGVVIACTMVVALLAVTLFAATRDDTTKRPTIAEPGTSSSVAPTTTVPTPTTTVRPVDVLRSELHAGEDLLDLGTVTFLAADDGAVYAERSDNVMPAGPVSIARIDLATGATTRSAPILQSPAPLVRAGQSLWTYDWPLAAGGGHQVVLVQIDPTSLTVRQRIPLDVGFASLAGTRDALWVAETGHLLRLDPNTGQVTMTTSLGASDGTPSVSVDDAHGIVYLSQGTGSSGGTFEISERDASSGAVLATRTDLCCHVGVVSASDGGVWVAYAGGMMSQVQLLRASDLGTAATFTQPGGDEAGTNSTEATVSGGYLWVLDDGGTQRSVSCADATTGRLLAQRSFDAPVSFGSLVVADGRAYLATVGLAVLQPDPSCSS